MNVFEGIEDPLVKGNFGTGAKYNAGLEIREANLATKSIQSKTTSPYDKFLQKSEQEKNNLVRYWNGEKFSRFSQLERNPKALKQFKTWLSKKSK